MNERLAWLGAEVARAQDEALADDRRRIAVRRRLLSVPELSAPPARSFRRPALGLAMASAALAAMVFWMWPGESEVIGYRVGEGPVSTGDDQWIMAPDAETVPIVFSDGSTVQLSPGSRARVRQLSAIGASLELAHGEATVHVRHGNQTSWSVEAGPFLVHVIGTRFRVEWEPTEEAFALKVFEGAVRLTGPGGTRRVDRNDGEVRAMLEPPTQVKTASKPAPEPEPETETTIEPASSRVISTVRPAPVPSSDHGVVQPPRPSSERNRLPYRPPSVPLELKLPPKAAEAGADQTAASEAPVLTEPDVQPPPNEEPPPVSEPQWKELAEDSEYEEALATLSPEEFEDAIREGDERDLVNLAAAARRTKDARAGYIYSVVRSRFSGTDGAANAAFMLGRMQFHAGAPHAAATWLETYLRERPSGRFAREASGRLIEAYLRAGDTSRAKAAARLYLARYPQGPHAALARSVLP